MELFSGMTDDQTALVGCGLALLACGGLMSLSYYLGRHRTAGRDDSAAAPRTLRMDAAQPVQAAEAPARRRRAA